ncbi:MAG: flavodoxin family protein [Deltaproteobacteria bacterium]|nr:flavodoxin family protein [Deltaproteobacteria bacterium]
MKIVGISCSPRKGKTIKYALESCFSAIKEAYPEVEMELIDLAEKQVNGCIACGQCMKKLECSQEDDFNEIVPILSDPALGGLIVATPVYLGSMSSPCKAFLDRCVMFRRNGFLFRDKVGGVITVGGARNGGQSVTIQQVHATMLVQDMILVGDGKPGAHFGGTMWSGHPDGVKHDDVGLKTVQSLGVRVTELALKLYV